MFNNTNKKIEKELLTRVFYPKEVRKWDEITKENSIFELLIDWFCIHITANTKIYPQQASKSEQLSLLLKTYAFGTMLAATSISKEDFHPIIDASTQQFGQQYEVNSIGNMKFAMERSAAINNYLREILDESNKGSDATDCTVLACEKYMEISGAKDINSIIVEVYAWREAFKKWAEQL